MKAITTTFLLLALPLAAQFKRTQNSDPFVSDESQPSIEPLYKEVVPKFNFGEATLEEVFGFLENQYPEFPSVIFKNGSGDFAISMSLRNVTLGNLLIVIEELGEVRIENLDNDPTDEHKGIFVIHPNRPVKTSTVGKPPVVGSPVAGRPQKNVAPDSANGSTEKNPDNSSPSGKSDELGYEWQISQATGNSSNYYGEYTTADSPTYAESKEPITRAYQLGKIDNEVVISAIKAMWESSDARWSKDNAGPAFSFHDASKLLIIRAPSARQMEANDIIAKINEGKSTSKSDLDLIVKRHESEMLFSKRLQDGLEDRLHRLQEILQEREIEMASLRAKIGELEKVNEGR